MHTYLPVGRINRIALLIVTGAVLILALLMTIALLVPSGAPVSAAAEPAAPTASVDCAGCHASETPGIMAQFEDSTMKDAGITCNNCHEVDEEYAGAIEHNGTYVLPSPSAARCAQCHEDNVDEFNQSRHGLPAYIAVIGSKDLSEDHLALYESIEEGSYSPDKSRNAIAAIEGEVMIRFTCLGCHNIGKPAEDGSVGQCQKCHLRHEFSLEQVRRPETCGQCHIGPDHSQWEIYQESPHGVAYLTGSDDWNWDADVDKVTVEDFPAPTCAICHMGAFGDEVEATHDIGERLTWYLFAPTSTRRPNWENNQATMQAVCSECHSSPYIEAFYEDADKATERVNEFVEESNEIIAPLKEQDLLTDEPFDEPIDFLFFDIWHYWGRTAKFGVWMQGPDYAQWHGIYELLDDMADLREEVAEKLSESE
jgi:hydroxylamine dehydrogenase